MKSAALPDCGPEQITDDQRQRGQRVCVVVQVVPAVLEGCQHAVPSILPSRPRARRLPEPTTTDKAIIVKVRKYVEIPP